jgi:hypothetical protein
MSLIQSLFTAAACSVGVGLLEWRVLRRIHGRTLAALKDRHRRQHLAASQMLTQCRRQIRQLQAEVTNARELSSRRSLRLVTQEPVSPAQQVRARADYSWPAGAFQPAVAFPDTRVEEGVRLLARAR